MCTIADDCAQIVDSGLKPPFEPCLTFPKFSKPQSGAKHQSIGDPQEIADYWLQTFRMEGGILTNRFRVPEVNPLFCESRFGGLKIANRGFEVICANRSHVMKIQEIFQVKSNKFFETSQKLCFYDNLRDLILAVLIMVPSLSRFLWPCRDKFQVAARANCNAIFGLA